MKSSTVFMKKKLVHCTDLPYLSLSQSLLREKLRRQVTNQGQRKEESEEEAGGLVDNFEITNLDLLLPTATANNDDNDGNDDSDDISYDSYCQDSIGLMHCCQSTKNKSCFQTLLLQQSLSTIPSENNNASEQETVDPPHYPSTLHNRLQRSHSLDDGYDMACNDGTTTSCNSEEDDQDDDDDESCFSSDGSSYCVDSVAEQRRRQQQQQQAPSSSMLKDHHPAMLASNNRFLQQSYEPLDTHSINTNGASRAA